MMQFIIVKQLHPHIEHKILSKCYLLLMYTWYVRVRHKSNRRRIIEIVDDVLETAICKGDATKTLIMHKTHLIRARLKRYVTI